MKTETLELDDRFGAEYHGKYVFREISWAKRNRIIQKYTKYNKLSGDVESSDLISIQAETIMASLHSQPESHPLSLEKLLSEDAEKGLPVELGELLSKTANRVCSLTKAETVFLSPASDVKNPIQHSPNLDFQKSSVGHPASLPSSQREQSNNLSSS